MIARSTPENIADPQGLAKELIDPTVFNVFLLYTPLEHVDVFADFRNVSDRGYALKGILGPTPQDTFRANAGLRWRF
jgi:hypothetical protein